MEKIKKILVVILIVAALAIYFWWNSPSGYYQIEEITLPNGETIYYKDCIIDSTLNISISQIGEIQYFIDEKKIILCNPI